jgi:hypothetical protein
MSITPACISGQLIRSCKAIIKRGVICPAENKNAQFLSCFCGTDCNMPTTTYSSTKIRLLPHIDFFLAFSKKYYKITESLKENLLAEKLRFRFGRFFEANGF